MNRKALTRPSPVHQTQPPAPPSAQVFGREMIRELERVSSRSAFFQTLSRLLRQHFAFDRLCINLYDPNSELLSYFCTPEGTMVNSLSPVRKAEKTTVARHVIASGKPVVITDIAQHFAESMLHPMAEAGLTTSVAFPLQINEKILGTLHCSFIQKPDNLDAILKLFLELCPYIAVCLGAVLAVEGLDQGLGICPLPPAMQPVGCEDFIFVGETMRRFMHRVGAVAKLDVPLLLLGETGTGKTHLAQYIHCHSKRSQQHFVKVNCPALVSSLFESELFGHAKGAFTGAAIKRIGRFELAHQGTLFLDEIAELSGEMQSKLLHVLDDRCFERVGESVSLAVDIRLMAATNVLVQDAVRQGRLRGDFYHRLSACVLELPPLRSRLEDIPVLTGYFVNRLAALYNLPRLKLGPGPLQMLQAYPWPGNIRELRNVVNGLLLQNCIAGQVTEHDVRQALAGGVASKGSVPAPPRDAHGSEADNGGWSTTQIRAAPAESLAESLEEAERRHILQTLARTGGVLSGPRGAAILLGLPRSTLQHRMRKLGIAPRRG